MAAGLALLRTIAVGDGRPNSASGGGCMRPTEARTRAASCADAINRRGFRVQRKASYDPSLYYVRFETFRASHLAKYLTLIASYPKSGCEVARADPSAREPRI